MLVLAPTGRDAALTCELLLRHGIAAATCASAEELRERTERDGAGALLIAEEALGAAALASLRELIDAQPSWSDIPVIVFGARAAQVADDRRLVRLIDGLGNVSLLERPMRTITLATAARAALRARRRQYEVRAALAAESRAVAARDEFLAMLGHELRNPLGAMTLAIEMLDRPGVDRERYRDILGRQAAHLGRLVDDLLDVSRVTSGKIALRPIAIQLADLVSRVVTANESALAERQLAIALALDPAVRVKADPVRLEQVLTNLLTNAIKYTPPGGHLRLTVAEEGEHGVFSVADDGVGIAAEMLPTVFELFAQVPGTIDRAQGGLGIGLTLVQNLVELHGGSVEAASAGLGLGSTFTVRLPRAPAPAVVSVDRRRNGSGIARTILVVDDNEDTASALSEYLEIAGHRVFAAGDGLQALARAEEVGPDVMIVDLGLPGIDGLEVARRVRAQRGDGIYLIALTGYGQPEDRRRSFEAGFDEHFTKPADLATLTRLLARPQLAPAPARAVHPADR